MIVVSIKIQGFIFQVKSQFSFITVAVISIIVLNFQVTKKVGALEMGKYIVHGPGYRR